MFLKDKIAEVRQYVVQLADEADAFESKRLRRILLSAAERLGDAERNPNAAPPAETGEPSPMDPGPQMISHSESPFPSAQTGEPNPTQQ